MPSLTSFHGFVEILAAQQTFPTHPHEGVADAVRKNLMHFLDHDFGIYSSSAAINCIVWFPEDDQ